MKRKIERLVDGPEYATFKEAYEAVLAGDWAYCADRPAAVWGPYMLRQYALREILIGINETAVDDEDETPRERWCVCARRDFPGQQKISQGKIWIEGCFVNIEDVPDWLARHLENFVAQHQD